MMRVFALRRWVALLAALTLVVGAACSTPGQRDAYNVRKINLSDADKRHILELAHGELAGQAVDRRAECASVYANEPRGVFVTAVRPNQAALTAFGWGGSIATAVKTATATLRRLGESEDLTKLPLRVDVIDETTDQHTRALKDPWKLDVSTQGLIFGAAPPLALLPQELRDWGVIDRKNRFVLNQFKKLAKQRGVGRVVRDEIADADKVKYALFTAISFMDGPDGAVVSLRRGNRAEQFDPTPDNLLGSIVAGADYLKRAVNAEGKFDYLYNPQLAASSKSYNELRHAGAVFAMMQVYEITEDPDLLAAAERAMGWLRDHTRGPNPADAVKGDWQALFDERLQVAKLGGAGLSLLAFGTHARVTGDRQNLPLMTGYARFIEHMMKPDGDVEMRYYFKHEDREKEEKDVLYYPGEAFFGLATLHQLDNEARWIDVASRGIDYIADVRDGKLSDAQIPHDHWLCYAINEVHKFKPKTNQVNHGWRIFNAMNSRFNETHKDPDYVGGYYKEPSSVSTSCRIEGTGALYRLARQLGDEARMAQFRGVMAKGAQFLMRTQYNDLNTMFFHEPKKALGGFMMSYWSPEIEIDYVQHTISALIAAREIALEQAGATK
jgi:hypothetical protein